MKNIIITIACGLLLAACATGDKEKPGTQNEKTSIHAPHVAHSAAVAGSINGNATDYSDSINKGLIAKDTMKGSPHRVAMANIGNVHVHIQYSAPGVKDRIIWGGLVPYGTVWVTGAHQATTINFSKDVVVGGKQIPKGSYAFFTLPGKEKWIAILNSKYEQHLTDEYKEEEDLLRVELIPDSLTAPVNRLSFSITSNTDTNGYINMAWEKIKISLPVSLKK